MSCKWDYLIGRSEFLAYANIIRPYDNGIIWIAAGLGMMVEICSPDQEIVTYAFSPGFPECGAPDLAVTKTRTIGGRITDQFVGDAFEVPEDVRHRITRQISRMFCQDAADTADYARIEPNLSTVQIYG